MLALLALLLILTLVRYISVLLNDYANKGVPMNKLLRHIVLFSGLFFETLWAGMVSVAAGGITSGVQSVWTLAKRI